MDEMNAYFELSYWTAAAMIAGVVLLAGAIFEMLWPASRRRPAQPIELS